MRCLERHLSYGAGAFVLVVLGFGAPVVVPGVVVVVVVPCVVVLVGSLEPLVDVGGVGAVLVGGTTGMAVLVRMRMWVLVDVGTATAALPGSRGPLGVPG
jgi:hypothetical protein